MYTTPLNKPTLISSCSLNHHLYADDTQLFLSFLPTHLHSSIDHFHNTLDRISSRMTANLLTLNSSKTEFLPKSTTPHLPPLTLLETPASNLMNTSLFLTTTQPSYLHNLITVQPPRSTRSLSLVTLARPSTSPSLRIIDRSFQYASPRLWNQLPASLRQPRTNLSNS